MHAADRAIPSLRLATHTTQLTAALSGPLALVLQECDTAPADANWDVATLIACDDERDELEAALMKAGGTSETALGEDGPREEWVDPQGGRVTVCYVSPLEALTTLDAFDRTDIDGVGSINGLAVERLTGSA